jgi:HK97 family phage portal protein
MFERVKRVLFENTDNNEIQVRSTNIGFIAKARERFLNGQDVVDSGPTQTRLAAPYPQHVSIFRCINLIATTLSDIPYLVRDGDITVTKDKSLIVLKEPNQVMNWTELILTFITDLLVTGNGFIIIEWDGNKIGRLLPVAGNLMTPILDPNDKFGLTVKKWEKNNGPENDPSYFDPEDVIHLPYAPSPVSRVMGVGPMYPVKLIADADYAAMWNNFSLLNGGGLPVGMLKFVGPGRLTEEMKEEVRDNWKRLYGSPRSSSRMAVINQDWAWQATGATKEELEFTANREWNLSDICRAFNIPKLYLFEQEKGAVGDATIRTHQKMFYYNNIIPLARRIEDRLNYKLLSKITKNLEGKFDFESVEPLREDFNKKVETGYTLVKMGFSPNSVNHGLKLGMEDMPWGDDSLAPVNMVPAQDIVDHKVVLPKQDKIEGLGSDQISNSKGESNVDQKQEKDRGLVDLWESSYFLIEGIEDRCSAKIRRLLSFDRTKILFQEANKISSDTISDGIMPFLVKAYVAGYRSISESEETEIYKKAALYANTRHDEIVMLCDTLSNLLKKKPIDETADRYLRSLLNRIIHKIDELCRPEIFRAFNTGRYNAIGESDIKMCVWVASPDTHCRDASNHGDKRAIGEPFKTGRRHPGDGSEAGCDCIICPE